MPLVSKVIPGFFNGVSQQAASLRLETQCELLENGLTTLEYGLMKRPNTEYIATLNGAFTDNVILHPINRDLNERYIVLFKNDANNPIEIYNLAGQAMTVNYATAAAKSYAVSVNPKSDIKATTVADYTIVVNANVIPAMKSDIAPVPAPVALVNIKRGVASTRYQIYIDGTLKAETVTSSTDAAQSQTTWIAGDLKGKLDTALGSGWTINIAGSTLQIKKNDGSDFQFYVTDSYGDQAMAGIKGSVQRFSDLPVKAWEGNIVEIRGDADNLFASYFVQYETSTGSKSGVWAETVKPGLRNSFDETTMPHQLVRTAPNTFTFSAIDWASRKAGNEYTAPEPSFINHPIHDVFFFKNRLGFLTGENVVLSKAGEYFDFFPTTGLEVLDDDPIDVGISTNQVNILYHAVPFNKSLLLFSEQQQFISSGGEMLLTPKTIAFNPSTSYQTSTVCKPVAIGSSVYMTVPNGNYSSIREYYVQPDSLIDDAVDTTAHVPEYVPKGIKTLAASGSKNIMFALTPDEKNALYVYKFFWDGPQKAQSSWSKWIFGTEIIDIAVIDNFLFLVISDNNQPLLVKMNLENVKTGSLRCRILLDRMVTVHGAYNPATKETTWILPFATPDDNYAIIRSDKGLTVPYSLKTAPDTIKAPGDYSDSPCYIGFNYTMRYRFTEWFVRDNNNVADTQGRLQIRTLTLSFTKTSTFKVEVKPFQRETLEHYYSGVIVGVSPLGVLDTITDSERFLILANARHTQIDIVNDKPYPCEFQTAGFEGFYTVRSRAF